MKTSDKISQYKTCYKETNSKKRRSNQTDQTDVIELILLIAI